MTFCTAESPSLSLRTSIFLNYKDSTDKRVDYKHVAAFLGAVCLIFMIRDRLSFFKLLMMLEMELRKLVESIPFDFEAIIDGMRGGQLVWRHLVSDNRILSIIIVMIIHRTDMDLELLESEIVELRLILIGNGL